MLIDKYLSITDKTPRGTGLRGGRKRRNGTKGAGSGTDGKKPCKSGASATERPGAAVGYRILQRAQQRTTEAK